MELKLGEVEEASDEEMGRVVDEDGAADSAGVEHVV